jgi:peptidoglycan/xylan/chitin deacetylase (PgdA/CDA1 family)
VEIKTYKSSRVNHTVIFLVGLLILSGSVITYLLILRGVFGKFNLSSLIPDSKVIQTVMNGGETKVAVLYSKYTENMLPEGNSWLNDNISTWEKFLGNSGLKYDVISDEAIEKGSHFSYNILVLPGSRSLSDLEISQIKKFIDGGGSVFATNGTASYSQDGKWRGWDFFSEVFGIRFMKELKYDEDNTRVHTLRGESAVTFNIPAGYPLNVATWDRPIAAEILDPRTTQVSFWYNYRLDEGLVREEIKKSAGIVYGTYGKGRFIWMGFEINSILGVRDDYVYFDKLFRNCINWLHYGPVAHIKEWPNGYDAAAVVSPVISEDNSYSRNLLNIIDAEKIQATFFVDPYKAADNKSFVLNLLNFGEISSLVDLGYLSSVNDTINHLYSYDLQFKKLNEAKNIIESISGTKVNGCYPYYGLFDKNSEIALINAGYKYVMTDSLTDRSVPKILVRGDHKILCMTKTTRDDYEVIRDFGLTIPEYQFYTYQEDVDRVLFEGGMYIMKIHPEYQCKSEYINVIRQIIQDMKQKNFWITTASEIQNWYSKRNNVEIRADKKGESRVAVTISNPGPDMVSQFVIQVDLNDNADAVSLSTEIISTESTKYQHLKGSKVVNLFINNLKSGESRTYYLDYDKSNA